MNTAGRNDPMERKKPSFFKRTLIVLLVTLLLLGMGSYGALYILLEGPSDYAAGLFAHAVEELPYGDTVLHLFLSDEEIHRDKLVADVDSDGCTGTVFSVYPWSE